jgi:hypothetical protein
MILLTCMLKKWENYAVGDFGWCFVRPNPVDKLRQKFLIANRSDKSTAGEIKGMAAWGNTYTEMKRSK